MGREWVLAGALWYETCGLPIKVAGASALRPNLGHATSPSTSTEADVPGVPVPVGRKALVWDRPVVPFRRVQRQVLRQNPTHCVRAINLATRPQRAVC